MTVLEAFAMTVDFLKHFEEMGIVVKRRPSKSKDRPEVVKKYSGTDRLPPELWENVSMFPVGDEQNDAIKEARKILGWRGISFDYGGCDGLRDWELDWSFRLTETPDGERENRQDVVDRLIGELEQEDE